MILSEEWKDATWDKFVTDATDRPLRFFRSAGQVSGYTGAAARLGSLPTAEWLIANRGYDAHWFREALKDKGIKLCIPGRKSRGKPVKYDKRRNRSEIMFGQSEGLATCRNSLRQMRQDFPLHGRSRRHGHALALKINETRP